MESQQSLALEVALLRASPLAVGLPTLPPRAAVRSDAVAAGWGCSDVLKIETLGEAIPIRA